MPFELVWITGAWGLIGNYLVQTAARHASRCQIIGVARDAKGPPVAPKDGTTVWGLRTSSPQSEYLALDLTNSSAVARAFDEHPPQLVIHCAALSKSPVCQANPELAWKLNVEVTRHLAELSADIPFILLSSDLVFDGRKGNYVETDSPNPLSVYGKTKLAAEQMVLANSKHIVVRTSLNFGSSPTGDRSFNEELRLAWQAGKEFTFFTDEFRCPIPAVVTAQALWELARLNQPGLYHLAGAERLSRWQIGQLLAARWPQLHPRIHPGTIKDYQGALRSPDTSLNCAKVQRLLSFQLPGLTEWLTANSNELV